MASSRSTRIRPWAAVHWNSGRCIWRCSASNRLRACGSSCVSITIRGEPARMIAASSDSFGRIDGDVWRQVGKAHSEKKATNSANSLFCGKTLRLSWSDLGPKGSFRAVRVRKFWIITTGLVILRAYAIRSVTCTAAGRPLVGDFRRVQTAVVPARSSLGRAGRVAVTAHGCGRRRTQPHHLFLATAYLLGLAGVAKSSWPISTWPGWSSRPAGSLHAS